MQNQKPDYPASLSPRFSLGETVATRGALALLDHEEIVLAISRHVHGDWGVIDKVDAKRNEEALKDDSRLVSAYISKTGEKFFIITEWDRSYTTILLPSEY